MLSHKMDFNCCANRDGFPRDSHICYTSGTLKICLNLKENVQLAYIVTDADYDSGKLF